MADRNSRMVEVDRPAQDGDTVLIDYAGFVGDEQFEGGTAERYPLKLGSGSFIPGFEDQLIGASKDEEVEVKVTFPEEYHSEELAGKEAIFKCKVHEIKEKVEEAIEIIEEDVKEKVEEELNKNETKRDTMTLLTDKELLNDSNRDPDFTAEFIDAGIETVHRQRLHL